MPLKLNDLIITDVWSVAGFDIVSGKPLFNLINCDNTTFDSPSTKSEITGGKGAKVLAVVASEKKATLTVESATFDLNLLALQTGDENSIYGTSVSVPTSEKITISNDITYTSTILHTPSADCIVGVMLDDGTPLVEGDTVSATEFTVADKTLTFDETHKGKTGTVFYETSAPEAVDITIDANAKIKYATIKAEISLQNQCDGLNYLGSIIMPRASIDQTFSIATTKTASDNAIHNAVFDAVSSCGNSKLARIVIYDANSLV